MQAKRVREGEKREHKKIEGKKICGIFILWIASEAWNMFKWYNNAKLLCRGPAFVQPHIHESHTEDILLPPLPFAELAEWWASMGFHP